MDQPALWEMSCHHFDSLLALFPDAHAEGVSIDGFRLSWSPYSGPCMVHGLIRFAGGPHVLYHAGFSSRADCYELRLEGSRGALRCRGIHMAHDSMAYEWAEAGGPWTPCAVDDGIPARNPWFEFFERWRIFLDAGGNPSFSGQRNLQVLAMLDAALESERSNAFVQVAGNPRFEKAFERHSREHVSAS